MGKNKNEKLKELATKGNQTVLPPEIHHANLPAPTSLDTVLDIKNEMSRIYKLVFKGQIALADATRLAYYLDKMIQAIKTQAELDVVQAAYAKAWGGVNVITDPEAIDGYV